MAHNDRKKPCHICERVVAHTLDGRPYTHKCVVEELTPEGFENPTPRGVTKFPVSDPAPTVDSVDTKTGPKDPVEAFLFEDPTEAVQKAIVDAVVNRGRYQIKDPATGDYRRYKNGNINGYTRATTFIKAAQDSKSLNDWQKRNVLIGAAKRPDIAARAWGKGHADKAELDRYVDELMEAANAKVSAEMGSDLHDWRQRLDGGECTLDDTPPQWRSYLAGYVQGLRERGLMAVPGMSERITMIQEFGGVAGRLDDVYYHGASGKYYVGDLKTGKTLDYGKKEIPGQLWIYAHGLNQNGMYDEAEHEWVPAGDSRIYDDPFRVSETTGLVMWMPVDGPSAGQFYVKRADLVHGRAYAEECHRNRSFPNPKWEDWEPVPQADPDDPDVPSADDEDWDAEFAAVQDKDDATAAWQAARAAGITGIELNRLIGIAQQALRSKG